MSSDIARLCEIRERIICQQQRQSRSTSLNLPRRSLSASNDHPSLLSTTAGSGAVRSFIAIISSDPDGFDWGHMPADPITRSTFNLAATSHQLNSAVVEV